MNKEIKKQFIELKSELKLNIDSKNINRKDAVKLKLKSENSKTHRKCNKS